MSKFSDKVIGVVKQIPNGKVVSYGQVAAYVGVPRGARQVGGVLRTHDEQDLPWWRVINNAGRISIKNMFHSTDEQRNLLQKEGVQVSDDYSIIIDKYRFSPSQEVLKSWGLDEIYVQMIWSKFKRAY